MQRHPEYRYNLNPNFFKSNLIRIEDPDHNNWGEAVMDTWDEENYKGPVELLLRIREKKNWTIKEVGIGQYSFEEDKLNLIFQWDDLFGFVIVVNDPVTKEEAVSSMLN